VRTGPERLANWILAHDDKTGRSGSFRLPMEKKTLANMLGMRPENLSRTLGELASHGVEVKGARLTIADRTALARFARPDPLIDDHGI
jgi:CRP/FNR family transcriptional activator FtrB